MERNERRILPLLERFSLPLPLSLASPVGTALVLGETAAGGGDTGVGAGVGGGGPTWGSEGDRVRSSDGS